MIGSGKLLKFISYEAVRILNLIKNSWLKKSEKISENGKSDLVKLLSLNFSYFVLFIGFITLF